MILFENFDKNLWGGDLPARAPGYSRTDRSKATELYTARGDNPDQTDSNYYTSEAGTEIGLFNTLKGVVPAMGLDEWGWIADDNKTGCILSRAGYLKIGASSKHASLITPQLGALAGKAAVRVTFKACPYGADDHCGSRESGSRQGVQRYVVDAASHRITKYTEGDIATLTLEASQCTWKEYSVVLEDVEPTSRIAFCGNRAGNRRTEPFPYRRHTHLGRGCQRQSAHLHRTRQRYRRTARSRRLRNRRLQRRKDDAAERIR